MQTASQLVRSQDLEQSLIPALLLAAESGGGGTHNSLLLAARKFLAAATDTAQQLAGMCRLCRDVSGKQCRQPECQAALLCTAARSWQECEFLEWRLQGPLRLCCSCLALA